MTKLAWDAAGEHLFETGVDQGVLYIPDGTGAYVNGYAWNGLTTVTEAPTGGTPTAQYADNIKYLNLYSYEEWAGTVEAFTYPDQFAACDGSSQPEPGVSVGQQPRQTFGLCYRTKVGNDLSGTELGFKYHLVYGLTASPSQKAYATINDSPQAINFSWDVNSTPIVVDGYKPFSTITIDSTMVDSDALATLTDMLYGTVGDDPMLPDPASVLAIFSGTITVATPTVPTYDSGTDLVTIPSVTGLVYYIDGVLATAGTHHITESVVVTVRPLAGYKLPDVSVDRWLITFA